MGAAALIGAFASLAGVGLSAAQGAKQNDVSQKQQDIAKDQLDLQKQGARTGMEDRLRAFDQEIDDLEFKKMQYGIDIRDAASQVDSYDKWLGNYGAQYTQEVQSKQAQTDALMASGKDTYENFLNAIGYADAMAGATGRVGAGTSQAATTGMLDRKLVDYVGADRTLDANGGLFGSQLTAANMEMDQLKIDLDFQRQEMEANRGLAYSSIADWQSAIALTDQSIGKSTAARDKAKTDLEEFVAKNFPTGAQAPTEPIKQPPTSGYTHRSRPNRGRRR